MRGNQASVLRELERKGEIYAWTGAFFRDLLTLAAARPELVAVEVFAKPRDRRGFATPPMGRAVLLWDLGRPS